MSSSADSLLDWMTHQCAFSAKAMLRAISATQLVKIRAHLGQQIRPAHGSVLASPQIAAYDPDPDYFFHWLRDSAIVIDALRVLYEDRTLGPDALDHISDFMQFSLDLCRLDGRVVAERGDFRRNVSADFLRHVRSEKELRQVTGDRVLGEARYNPDGTLDILGWARPQNDGPALRALTALRVWRLEAFRQRADLGIAEQLLEADLDYTFNHWRDACFDLWEEIRGHHYYTRLLQLAALVEGAEWLEQKGDAARSRAFRAAADDISRCLDAHLDKDASYYRAFLPDFVQPSTIPDARRLDIAVVLGVIHAARSGDRHGVLDPKVLSTLLRLESLFTSEYKINQDRAADWGPAMGRYCGDVYFSGGAYYFSTLGVAQFYYLLAESLVRLAAIEISLEQREMFTGMFDAMPGQAFNTPGGRRKLAEAALKRGDMFMATVRIYTPPTGELAEQFSRDDGVQTSAKNLAWSYAAFITAHAGRNAASRAIGNCC
ncbi:glucan 1,4-alpha-glucosidase [Methylocystis sp. L43]|uniref:glucan 1,4-alpha-glucosidase n=1 Tax=Methylocystis rosea TaxID=173366 RepID=A0ABX6EPR4_9HYPH|nr:MULTISPECIES: glycoside hydrolase family 15 protein [Methylocystis]MBG0796309.1 glucan 1,4-alpha-glucosidase [Methylocystis sp. L43]MBG0804256.1 glucan 1,4-alpha-glucosidase [Methylocystis sp. H15]QGM95722.1 glucan 1,4-alpha-glucosidase [Methylocystis rosea]